MECREWSRGNAAPSSLPFEPVRVSQILGFTSLAQQYRLSDGMDSTTLENAECQPVEEEYCSYVTVPVSPPETNVLKFWEVCEVLDATNINLLTIPGNSLAR